MTRPRAIPDITEYVSCEKCIHAKVTMGEHCFCSEGVWSRNRLRDVKGITQFACADYREGDELWEEGRIGKDFFGGHRTYAEHWMK